MNPRSKALWFGLLAAAAAALIAARAFASDGLEQPKVGQPAPGFTATDSLGKTVSLDAYKGKFVVLEWTNHGCPFVGKHYKSGHMQLLQKEYTAKGVIWFSVISSRKGAQGYSTPAKANRDLVKWHAHPTAVLLDPSGKLGREYGATTTPDMYIIDPQGTLIYEGAIDDTPSTDLDDIKTANNYVSQALDAAMAGKPVETTMTKSYGCSIKYE